MPDIESTMESTMEPISIPLTPQQCAEFSALDVQERNAQLARSYAARAIILGLHGADVLNRPIVVDAPNGKIVLGPL